MTDASTTPPRSRRRKSVPALVGTLLTLVCVVFIVKALSSEWGEVRDDLTRASWWWLGAGLGCAALGMIAIAWVWTDALRLVGGDVPRRKVVPWYFVGEIGKYIPGAVWAAVGRGEVARRNGVPAGVSYPSVGLSLVGLYLAAALSAAALVPFDLAHQAHTGKWLLVLLLIPVGLIALHPGILEWFRKTVAKLAKRELDVVIPPWNRTIGLVLRYVPAWIGICTATWCVARALPGDPSFIRIALATLLSWTAGFVTPTPGGAGVREEVFVLFSGLGVGPGTAIAVASRLLFVIVDVVGFAVGAALTRSPAIRRSSVDSSVPEPPASAARNER